LKKFIICAAALLALAWAFAADAAEPRVGTYRRYDAGDFTIISSRSEAQAKRIMEDLARFRVALERGLGKRATRNATPTMIFITSASDWNQWLRPRDNVAGYFYAGRFTNYMALNGDEPLSQTLLVMFHEYTHYFIATQFAGEYPPWFQEGMAEVMGSAKFEKDQMIVRIPQYHVDETRDQDWIPFERMLRVSQRDPEYQGHSLAQAFYAQSWLTLHYAMVENRDFGRQIIDYMTELNKLVPQEEAARKVFGDLAAIDAQLREYSRRRVKYSGAMNLGELPPATIAEGKPIAELDTFALLADVMLEARIPPERARPLVEWLEAHDSAKARAAILAARLAQRTDDNGAFEAAVKRAEASLSAADWEQRRELGTVLLGNQLQSGMMSTRPEADTQRDLGRAMKWYAEAININNQDVESLWGFGTAATKLDKNLELAEQALLVAHDGAPWSSEIAVSLANLKGRQQKPEEMVPYLRDALRFATSNEIRRWASETLTETEKYLAERAKYEEENRKRREAYEKQLADYEKKYGKQKKD
jgi:hypothetical protein